MPKLTPSIVARIKFSGVKLDAGDSDERAVRGGQIGGAFTVEEGDEG